MAANKKTIKRRRERKNVEKGQVHIRSSFNNTMITVTDMQGNALSWASSGEMGFRGSLRCPDRRRDRRQRRHRPVRPQERRGVRQGSRPRARGRYPGIAGRGSGGHPHQGRDPRAPQRLPSPQASPRLIWKEENRYG